MHSLNKEQKQAVLAVAKKASERDYLALLLQFNHGLRLGELVSLTPENVRDGILRYRVLKQRKPTYNEHALTAEEQQMLSTWKAAADGTLLGITYRQYRYIFQKHCLTAGMPRHLAHTHTARHTAAMIWLNERKVPINAVQALLGHASLSSTGAYLKVSALEASRQAIL